MGRKQQACDAVGKLIALQTLDPQRVRWFCGDHVRRWSSRNYRCLVSCRWRKLAPASAVDKASATAVPAAGLVCFAGWRFLQSVFDADRHGTDRYGLMRRAMLGGSGVFYLALAAATARITFEARPVREDQSAREWAAWGHGAAVRTRPDRVDRDRICVSCDRPRAEDISGAVLRDALDATEAQRTMAVAFGSFGIMTRAFVFLVFGYFLSIAAYDGNSQEAVGLGGVLRAIQHQAYGGVLLGIAALGLLAFGFFEIIEASARRAAAVKPAGPRPDQLRDLR